MKLMNLKEKSQRDDNILGMVVKTDQEIVSLINDMNVKVKNIPELLLAPEQNKEGEETQLSSTTSGQDLLKGQISDNEKIFRLFGYFANKETENGAENGGKDKNTMVTVTKTESDSGVKRSALSDMLNITVKTGESESKTGQGELNKNNPEGQISNESKGAVDKEAGIQISKGPKGDVGKEAEPQLLKGLGADIAETIKNLETKGTRADGQIKHAAGTKDVEKTAATDRILVEGANARTGVEESKINNSPHIFHD
jgi:hypothetical protein